MNLAEHSLRVATLKAISNFVGKEYEAARKDAEAAYRENGIKSLTVSLPTGETVASITVIQPGPSVRVDEAALLEWAIAHTGTEVEEYLDSDALLDQELIEYCRENRDDLLHQRIRRLWRDELQKTLTANGGQVVDTLTGEATKVAEVTANKPTGAFSLLGLDKASNALILAALRAGQLAGVTPLALAAPADPLTAADRQAHEDQMSDALMTALSPEDHADFGRDLDED